LIPPHPEAPLAAQLVGYEANRDGPVAGRGDELEIHRHHLAEALKH
jgi:hypothetical protein